MAPQGKSGDHPLTRRRGTLDPLVEGSKILARLGDDIVDKLEVAGPRIVAGVDRALVADEPETVDISMTIGGDMTGFVEMMNRAIAIYRAE